MFCDNFVDVIRCFPHFILWTIVCLRQSWPFLIPENIFFPPSIFHLPLFISRIYTKTVRSFSNVLFFILSDFFSTTDCWEGSERCDMVQVFRLSSSPGTPSTLYTGASSTISGPNRFLITGFRRIFHVILKPDVLYLPPRVDEVVWTDRTKNTLQGNVSAFETPSCFYSGRIRGAPNSIVAVNLCHGMVSCCHLFIYIHIFINPPLEII